MLIVTIIIVAVIAGYFQNKLFSDNAHSLQIDRRPIVRNGNKVVIQNISDIAVYLRYRSERLRPLSAVKIKAIEEANQVVLPLAYKEFLSYMGNGAGNFMRGSSVFYDELVDLQFWANDLMEENNLPPLPSNSFAFWMHQGYQVAYFELDKGDDPPVYFYSEGMRQNEFILMSDSLTQFFLFELAQSYSEEEFDLPEKTIIDWKL